MDLPSELTIPVKRRRRHSPQFKAQVLEEALQYGVSVAAVARRHNLNANLIHKWLKTAQGGVPAASVTPAFIPLPAPSDSCQPEVRIEIPSALGAVTLSWPCDQHHSLAQFIKSFT